MTIRILASGGTLDKHYDEIAGTLGFSGTHLLEILARARITLPVELETLPLLDSLDMRDEDRARILQQCLNAREEKIIIVHGTDTMAETAQVIGKQNLSKTIVLTGAMIPYEVRNSDALFNLGFACGVVQTLSAGVYIAMNGQIFSWDNVIKDRLLGVFRAT